MTAGDWDKPLWCHHVFQPEPLLAADERRDASFVRRSTLQTAYAWLVQGMVSWGYSSQLHGGVSAISNRLFSHNMIQSLHQYYPPAIFSRCTGLPRSSWCVYGSTETWPWERWDQESFRVMMLLLVSSIILFMNKFIVKAGKQTSKFLPSFWDMRCYSHIFYSCELQRGHAVYELCSLRGYGEFSYDIE